MLKKLFRAYFTSDTIFIFFTLLCTKRSHCSMHFLTDMGSPGNKYEDLYASQESVILLLCISMMPENYLGSHLQHPYSENQQTTSRDLQIAHRNYLNTLPSLHPLDSAYYIVHDPDFMTQKNICTEFP